MADSHKRKVTVKCLYKGDETWPVDVEFEMSRKGNLARESLAVICKHLREAGLAPRPHSQAPTVAATPRDERQTPLPFPTIVPRCPTHFTDMKESKFEGKNGGVSWYCPKKIGDDFCPEKVTQV